MARACVPAPRSSSTRPIPTVLYSRHADVAMPIASISKLVTALTVADAKQPMDEVIEITDEDRAIGKGASSRLAWAPASPAATCSTWP